jgi:hypothetical protein
MSKSIDFTKPLSADDAAYVAERPWLLEEAVSAGIVDLDGAHTTDLISDLPSSDPAENDDPDEVDDEDDEDDEDETYSDEKLWTVAALKAEIQARNDERDEDEDENYIVIPKGAKRGDLVDLLIADDEAEAAADDDEADEE